jgi:hypothetical protein
MLGSEWVKVVVIKGHKYYMFINHFALDSDAYKVRLHKWIESARLVLNSSALLTKEHLSVLVVFR